MLCVESALQQGLSPGFGQTTYGALLKGL